MMRLADITEYRRLHKILSIPDGDAIRDHKINHETALDLLNKLIYKWTIEEKSNETEPRERQRNVN